MVYISVLVSFHYFSFNLGGSWTRIPVGIGSGLWCVCLCVFIPAKVLQDLFICHDDVHVSFRLSLCWGDSRFWWPFGCCHCLPGTECSWVCESSTNMSTFFVMFIELSYLVEVGMWDFVFTHIRGPFLLWSTYCHLDDMSGFEDTFLKSIYFGTYELFLSLL